MRIISSPKRQLEAEIMNHVTWELSHTFSQLGIFPPSTSTSMLRFLMEQLFCRTLPSADHSRDVTEELVAASLMIVSLITLLTISWLQWSDIDKSDKTLTTAYQILVLHLSSYCFEHLLFTLTFRLWRKSILQKKKKKYIKKTMLL